MVQGFLPRFYFFGIKIIFSIISEAPADAHILVIVFQPEKILAAYPASFIGIFSTDSVCEKLRHSGNIIYGVGVEFAFQHCAVGYSAASGKQIVKMLSFRKMRDNPFGYLVLASHVGQSVVHTDIVKKNINKIQ